MIIERKVGGKVYRVTIDETAPVGIIERYAKKQLDKYIAYDQAKPAIEQWKSDWQYKKQKVQELKEAALQHYRVTVPLPAQAIIKKYSSEEMVISSGQLDVLSRVMNPGVVSIIHEMRAKLDYNILKAYWNAELDWANMRNTYPQIKA